MTTDGLPAWIPSVRLRPIRALMPANLASLATRFGQ